DADQMLDSEELDGVMIGTRCSLHTKMALKVLKRNIPLFLEKPVSTNMDDLFALREAGKISKSEVVVSFPLRTSVMIKEVKEILDSGRIGTIEHVQAINNVPYGSVYYHSWYRDENEMQGLFLQKATHDFDYINYLLNIKPVKICAMSSKQIFKGNKSAGLYCKDCDDYGTCPESPFLLRHFAGEPVMGDMCSFATDTGNEDSGSALIKYETGMHASFSQNFFIRKKAASRGARLMGYKGTVEFDWYLNEIKVIMHHRPVVETHTFDTSSLSHFGGDLYLANNFINVMLGKEKSCTPLEAGLLSVLMCLKARESAVKDEFRDIRWPGEMI
ncbi:MAG: Gfo/Idh/MocA family oxidoreductase, partial [Clostridiales bacterium]|nr:Gfo/Idh/MocA family oxidoreductase [Clostridiales bacterium]